MYVIAGQSWRRQCLAVRHQRRDVAGASEWHRTPDRFCIENVVDCGVKLRAKSTKKPSPSSGLCVSLTRICMVAILCSLQITSPSPLSSTLRRTCPAMTAARLQRYALFLAGHRYSIEYRNTPEHANAQGLSRLPLASDAASHPVDVEVDAFHVALLEHLPITETQIRTATRQDPTWSSVNNAIQNGKVESITDLQPFASRFKQLATHQGCLLWGSRVAVPPSLQARILQELHLSHPGIVRMKELARSYVWWPRIDQVIEKTVRECNGCQLQQKQPSSAPLHPWEWPARPRQRVHVDFAGPFLGSMFLLLVQFQDFLQGNGIQHIRSAPYHPSTNGLVERFVHTFKHAMRTSETRPSGSTSDCSAFF